MNQTELTFSNADRDLFLIDGDNAHSQKITNKFKS